jgi:hypothetical protein
MSTPPQGGVFVCGEFCQAAFAQRVEGIALALTLRIPETKKPAFAGFIIMSRGAQERTRTSTVLPAST